MKQVGPGRLRTPQISLKRRGIASGTRGRPLNGSEAFDLAKYLLQEYPGQFTICAPPPPPKPEPSNKRGRGPVKQKTVTLKQDTFCKARKWNMTFHTVCPLDQLDGDPRVWEQ